MSPSQFHDDQNVRREINGPRPSPLKVNKESHFIQKTSSYSSSSISSSLTGVAATAAKQQQQHHNVPPHQQRHPVIIYTHSPKIIHTQARDFMALVQKLTGLSNSDDRPVQPLSQEIRQASSSEGNKNMKALGHDDNESSSVVTDETCSAVGGGQVSSSSVSPIFDPSNPYLSDIPLFTPNSTDFFCSSRPFYRYSDSVFMTPNMGSSISPSVLEVMKGYPEY